MHHKLGIEFSTRALNRAFSEDSIEVLLGDLTQGFVASKCLLPVH